MSVSERRRLWGLLVGTGWAEPGGKATPRTWGTEAQHREGPGILLQRPGEGPVAKGTVGHY